MEAGVGLVLSVELSLDWVGLIQDLGKAARRVADGFSISQDDAS